MGSSDKPPRAAYMVDMDETSGKAVRGSRIVASTKEKEKEKPKVSHRDSRPGKTKKSHSDTGPAGGHSAAGAHDMEVMRRERDGKLERRKSSSANLSSPHKSSRPPSSHESRGFSKGSTPSKSKREDPSHFGIAAPTYRAPPVVSQALPIRPRPVTAQTFPTRPLSYHPPSLPGAGYGPPLSNSAFSHQQSSLVTPSFPPPSPQFSFIRHAAPLQPVASQSDYFASHLTGPVRPLSARFDSNPRTPAAAHDPVQRTTSAFQSREVPRQPFADDYDDTSYYEDSYASAESSALRSYVSMEAPVRRRESIRQPSGISKAEMNYSTGQSRTSPAEQNYQTAPPRLTQAEIDYAAMPPPAIRPGILRRQTIESSVDPFDDGSEYREVRKKYHDESRPRRPSTNRNSVSYDLGSDSERVRIETANNGRRRQSYYGQSASTESSGYEDKMQQAASYQENIAGPSVPLTADLLKRQQRRQAGSSRSTKSSGSRDESDYRKSVTTRTTRSGSGNDDENLTIKVMGTARVIVGGAQIDCTDGGEIEIKRNQKAIRNGSERSNSEYGGGSRFDDRKSRAERLPGRSRMGSQHSYPRATPQYLGESYF